MLQTVNKFSSHPEGMLDRDQRTIFILTKKSHEIIPLNCTTCCCDDCKPKYFDIRKKCLNSNVNCDYLHSNNVRKKKVTRFFHKLNKYLLAFFCIWILTSQHFQPKTIMARPVHMSSGYEEPNESLATLQTLLSNPCAFEALKSGSDSTDNRRQRTFDNGDVKSALEQIAKAANTGLSDFKTTHLPNYFKVEYNLSHFNDEEMDQKIAGHHKAWKHQSNGNLLPNNTDLEIEFRKDLSEATKLFAEESARKFNVASHVDRQQLLNILTDCDERLQRLLVVFYQMRQNLYDYTINARELEATANISAIYETNINIIKNNLCEVRTAIYKLYETTGIENQPANIVDIQRIWYHPFKTNSVGDWANLRQLHDQLDYMKQFFGIWANEISTQESI